METTDLLPRPAFGGGGASALLTRDGTETFESIAKPALSPPGWVFPVV